MRLSLRTKILLFVVGPTALLLGGALLWALEQLNADGEAASRAALERRVEEVAKGTNLRLELYRLAAENVAFSVAMRAGGDIDSVARSDFFEVVRHAVEANSWIPGAFIGLRPGVWRGAERFAPLAYRKDGELQTFDIVDGYDYVERDWYQVPRDTLAAYWTQPFFGAGSDRWIVSFMTPMMEGGEFVGVAGVDIVLKSLGESMGLDEDEQQGFVAVTAAGQILFHPSTESIGKFHDDPSLTQLTPAVQVLTETLGTASQSGLRRVETDAGAVDIAIAELPAAGWRVGLAVDESALLAESNARTRGAALLLGAVFLGSAVLALVFSGRVVAPLERLEQGARRVAKGELEVVSEEDTGDEVGRLSSALAEMTRQIRSRESELNELAYVDGLTGLDNREMFARRLSMLIRTAERRGSGLAVMFIDLDGFKRVNDSLGHDAGDVVLKEVASRLQHSLRSADEVGRFSTETQTEDVASEGDLAGAHFARLAGDEFTIALPDVGSPDHARAAANRLLNNLSQTYSVGAVNVVLTASIGISMYPDDGASFDQLLKNADTAMYQAKSAGKNTFEFYNRAMTESVSERLEIDSRLRVAIEQRALEVHYQPLVPTSARGLLGVECLLRWTDDKLGVVRPDVFVAIAEESSLINDLGWYVIEAAVAQLVRWRDRGVAVDYLAINTAGRQLVPASFANDLLGRLRAVDLPPSAIELELTERTLMSEERTVEANLRQLAEHGVRLSVDDFGTGYSSLSYLQRFPLERLKVDKAFVDGLPDDEGSAAITRAVVAMSHCLGMDVVAEGVETSQQVDFLVDASVDVAQGWLFARALPSAAFETWLRDEYPALRVAELGAATRV